MSEQELIEQLERLTTGLLWLSESDYPWQIVSWEDLPENQAVEEDSEEAIAQQTAQIKAQIKNRLITINPEQNSTQIEERELEDFFQGVTTSEEWYREEELAECKRYQDLVNFLKNSLKVVKVYRLGKVEVKVYVMGQTPNGNILGIETISVET